MNGREYFKERIGFILLNGMLLVACDLLMFYLKVNVIWIIGINSIGVLPIGSYMIMEYLKYKKYYKQLEEVLETLHPKYLLTEVMDEPSFEEGRPFFEVLRVTNREMHERVKYYENQQQEYKEYIESWIHEIKTPIASAELIIENNPHEATYKLGDEIRRIDAYVEQALYYARSNEVNQDYLIKPFVLRGCVMKVIKAYSRDLIQHHMKIDVGDLEEVVHSDTKWVEFIIGQLLANSMKYACEGERQLVIRSYETKNQVILSIEDNGIGIAEKDLRRVFDKGFTGENGRRIAKSTGIGLYLCKKLCDRLGIGIKIDAVLGEGTTVNVMFPIGSMTKMNE